MGSAAGGRGRSGGASTVTATTPALSMHGRKQARSGAWAAASVMHRDAGAATGEIYEGDLMHGMPHGTGVCVYRNGLMYDGQWVAGRESGQGIISDPDDVVVYQGEVLDGTPHGAGAYFYASGDRYTGHWKDGLFHGKGYFVAASGASHDGDVRA